MPDLQNTLDRISEADEMRKRVIFPMYPWICKFCDKDFTGAEREHVAYPHIVGLCADRNVYYIDAPDDDEPISVERIEINWQFIQGAFWGLVFAGTLWAGICLVFAASRTR